MWWVCVGTEPIVNEGRDQAKRENVAETYAALKNGQNGIIQALGKLHHFSSLGIATKTYSSVTF